MKNLNLTPHARRQTIQELAHAAPTGGETWKPTGLKVNPDTWKRAKRYAADHDMKLQTLVDQALRHYLADKH